jgi:hypothetical protein
MEPKTSTRNPRPSTLSSSSSPRDRNRREGSSRTSSAAAAPSCFGLRPPPAPGQPTVTKSILVSPRIHPMEQGQPAATPLRVFGPSSGARARRVTLPPLRPRTGDAIPAPHCAPSAGLLKPESRLHLTSLNPREVDLIGQVAMYRASSSAS